MQLSWSERRVQARRGRWPRPLPPSLRGAAPWLIGGAAAALLVGGLLALRSSSPEPAGRSREFRLATVRHVNTGGAYAFHHPPGWKVLDEGSASRVSDPSGEAVVAFGLGASGSLDEASGRLVSTILDRYRDARAHAAEVTTMAGVPAVSVSGSARNEERVPIRFLAITLAAAARNYSIVVYTAADAAPAMVMPPVQEMLDSFAPVG